MDKICCIFFEDKNNIQEIYKKLDVVERYGDCSKDEDGNVLKYLHTWDEGYRTLKKCSKCGNYVLLQASEIHLFGEDVYYTDYIAVDSPEHARELNKKYNGFEIEKDANLPIIFYRNEIYINTWHLKE